MKSQSAAKQKTSFNNNNILKRIKSTARKDWQLYALCALPILYFIIFHYVPMYGVQIAFRDFKAADGITGSEWVGFEHFIRFFTRPNFWTLIANTLRLSFSQIIFGFPIPIILAILLNQAKNGRFRKFVQTVTYIPHFISIVVLIGMLYIFLSPHTGIINNIITMFGGEPINFMGSTDWFTTVFVTSGVWQHAGWNAIIYIATLAGVSPDLYEAAQVDGANKWRLIWHIDLPSLMPTIVMMLILEMGKVMNLGFQKVFLMQNDLNIGASQIISTYVYEIGIIDAQYSYSAAIGLFNNIINIILLITFNQLAKKVTSNSLW